MAGVVLATGIVEVIPSMRGSEKAVTSDLSRIDTKPVGEQLGKSMGGGMAGALRKVVAPALAILGAGQIKEFAKSAVGSFAELEDSTAAAGVVFGKSMGTIIKQSQGASKSLGLSSQQVINAANTYGTYGKAAGLSGDKLANFSADFTTLAGDLASFKGTSTEQSIEAIGAALRGETEPLRAYGVMLDDASMRQAALSLGLVKTTKEALTPQQKILAAQKLIWEQTTDAQGDFQRTSTSTANIQKTLAAETENVSAKFGKVLAPAFTAARTKALGVVGSVSVLLDRVLAFQSALFAGALTPDLVRALGMDPAQGFGKVVGETIGGLRAFTAAWEANDGEVTSSGFAGFMESAAFTIRSAVDGIAERVKPMWAALMSGNFNEFGALFTAVTTIAKPAGPIMLEVGQAVGSMSGEIGQLVAGALPLLLPLLQGATGVMNFLADNSWALTAAIVGLAAGFVVVKGAQAAANIAALAHVPVALAQAGANWSLASALRAQTAAQGQATTAGQIQTGVQQRQTVATVATTAATGGYSIATKIAAGATKVFSLAVKALPFVGIAVAIAGLVAGIVWFFTETEMGRAIVAAAWAGIQTAVGAVVSWFQNDALPMIQGVFGAIGAVAAWLYENAIRPAFEGIQAAIGAVGQFFVGLYNTVKPVFDGIGVVLNAFFLLGRGIFQIIVSLLVNVLAPAFVNLWNGVIAPVFAGIGAAIATWWTAAGIIFGAVVGFVRDQLGAIFTWLQVNIIQPVFGAIAAYVGWWWGVAQGVFNAVIGFVRDVLGPAFSWFYNTIIKPVFDGISGTISNVWNTGIKPIFDFIGDAISKTVPKAFDTGASAIETIWNTIQDIAKAPVKFVVETVLNNGLIAGFNTIAGILPGVDKLPRIELPAGFREGGYTGNKPVGAVAGVVHGREYVVPADSTQRLERTHPGALDYIRTYGRLPGADSGVAGYRAGGWVWPVNGSYPISQYPNPGHPAYDIGTPVGTSVYATQAGRVSHAGPGATAPGVFGGNEIHIDHGGVESWYAHLSGFMARVGEIVQQGQLIAASGNTGISSGPHLHYGARVGNSFVSPDAYLNGAPGYDPSMIGKGGGTPNPLAGIIEGLVQSFRDTFPGGGPFLDAVIGIGRKIVDGVAEWVGNNLPFGNTAGPTVFDGGGWLHNTGGAQLVQHNKSKPDAVLSSQQWADISKLAADRPEFDQKPVDGQGPDPLAGARVTLEIDGRELHTTIKNVKRDYGDI